MVGKAAQRVVLEVLGWILVVLGIAGLLLPGPGLLPLFAGLVLLSQQYDWAERRVRPVERAAKKAAAESVQSWFKITLSLLGVSWLVGLGIFWGVRPAAPDWWPLREDWWLLGGWAAGGTLIASGILALAMIVYSFRRYRGLSEEEIVAEVEMSSRGNSTT
jgi:uncharacterized protein (TIGR02611 family)